LSLLRHSRRQWCHYLASQGVEAWHQAFAVTIRGCLVNTISRIAFICTLRGVAGMNLMCLMYLCTSAPIGSLDLCRRCLMHRCTGVQSWLVTNLNRLTFCNVYDVEKGLCFCCCSCGHCQAPKGSPPPSAWSFPTSQPPKGLYPTDTKLTHTDPTDARHPRPMRYYGTDGPGPRPSQNSTQNAKATQKLFPCGCRAAEKVNPSKASSKARCSARAWSWGLGYLSLSS
jgi:hypothetical protein